MKTQMKFQKILTLCSLIFAALVLVYVLFFCSGMLFEIKFYTEQTEPQAKEDDNKFVPGAIALYEYTQKANNTLLILAIIFILCVALLYIMACNKRRNYYITNYVAIGIIVVFAVVFAAVLLAVVAKTLSLCGDVDKVIWKAHYDYIKRVKVGKDWIETPGTKPQHYSENVATPYLGIVVAIGLLVVAAAWVLNTLWKVKLMKGEKALLENEQVKEVA